MTVQQAVRQAAGDSGRINQVRAKTGSTGETLTLAYRLLGEAGHGSFGVVAKAELVQGGSGVVAVKRTKQDRRFKNRELQIMCAVHHPNVIKLHCFWLEPSPAHEEANILYLVLEYLPETLHSVVRSFIRQKQRFPELLVKLYMYQLLRALAYLHSMGICHRDIKPHNLMCDPPAGRLVLIDFGSAKVLKPGERNISYTCSRFYRAPELILSATLYNESIDLWATGCVLAECLAGRTFFAGADGVDQLIEIIKVLGTPTIRELKAMCPVGREYDYDLGLVNPVPFAVLLPHASPEALDLLSTLLVYSPTSRSSAIEAMCHPFFDDLRFGNVKDTRGGSGWGLELPDGQRVTAALFDFTAQELSIRPDLIRILVPPHARPALLSGPERIDINHFHPIDLAPLRLGVD